jgi:hypothetical protein
MKTGPKGKKSVTGTPALAPGKGPSSLSRFAHWFSASMTVFVLSEAPRESVSETFRLAVTLSTLISVPCLMFIRTKSQSMADKFSVGMEHHSFGKIIFRLLQLLEVWLGACLLPLGRGRWW